VSLLLCGYETIIVLLENPAGTFGGSAVVWLRDHNRIVCKSLGRFIVTLLSVLVTSHKLSIIPISRGHA
jgi:hypothetical protein